MQENKFKTGFTLIEILLTMLVVSFTVVASLPMLTQKLASLGVHEDTNNCFMEDGANINATSCKQAMAECRYNLGNSCNSIFFLAENPAYTDDAEGVLKQACINGSKRACDYFIDQCIVDSNDCDKTGTNDLRGLLTIDSDGIDTEIFYLFVKVREYLSELIPNIENEVISSCQENPIGIACEMFSMQAIEFTRKYRNDFFEENGINKTSFYADRAQTVWNVIGNYYITTTDNNQFTDVNKIISTAITQTEPINTTIRWLVSFDSRGQWQKWDGSSWVNATTDLSTYDFVANANTATEIQTGLADYEPPNATIDFAVEVASSTGTNIPKIYKIEMYYY